MLVQTENLCTYPAVLSSLMRVKFRFTRGSMGIESGNVN
jgi:hypothetical protein